MLFRSNNAISKTNVKSNWNGKISLLSHRYFKVFAFTTSRNTGAVYMVTVVGAGTVYINIA